MHIYVLISSKNNIIFLHKNVYIAAASNKRSKRYKNGKMHNYGAMLKKPVLKDSMY